MKTFKQMIGESLESIPEIFPWDLQDLLENPEERKNIFLVDVREPAEFEKMHIQGSLNVPRGILEPAADWGYDETEVDLVQSRDKKVVVICRSGNRSALAALTLKSMGFRDLISLKTGVRGWNDSDQPLQDSHGNAVDPDEADVFLNPVVPPEKLGPQN